MRRTEVEELLPTLHIDCVTISYCLYSGCPYPRLTIRTSSAPITTATVDALMEYGQRVLDRGEQHSCLWDLRASRIALELLLFARMAGPLWPLGRWASENRPTLDANLLCVVTPRHTCMHTARTLHTACTPHAYL